MDSWQTNSRECSLLIAVDPFSLLRVVILCERDADDMCSAEEYHVYIAI